MLIVGCLFQILDKILDELLGKDAMAPNLVVLQYISILLKMELSKAKHIGSQMDQRYPRYEKVF